MQPQQESERIEKHIENKREDLSRNLEELETRVRSTLNWRTYYDHNPWVFLAAAFVGSAALTAMMSGRDLAPSYAKFGRTWSNVQAALLALAAKQGEQLMEELVPGFRDEYRARTARM